MKRIEKTKRPPMLTVNGRTQAAASTHREVASHFDAVASIHRGLAQASKGAGRLADEVFDELEREDSG